jgi:hypothetical protein
VRCETRGDGDGDWRTSFSSAAERKEKGGREEGAKMNTGAQAWPWETTRAKLQSAAALAQEVRVGGVWRAGRRPEDAAETVHDEDVVLVPAAAALRTEAAQVMQATGQRARDCVCREQSR